jgi:FAD binding domain
MVRRSGAAIKSADGAGLRRGFQGQVLLPGQGGYDQARRVWNAMVDRHPVMIARCASPADVAAAVGFARAHGLEVGVRCGGHSVLGLSVPDGGLMLDCRQWAWSGSTRAAPRLGRRRRAAR